MRVLDACCGSRMFHFNRTNPDVLFADIRTENHTLCDGRSLDIAPDLQMDFRAMPLQNESFNLVIFDPPHLKNLGGSSWMAKKYGKLFADWQDDLRAGFSECFRVLKTGGTLIFKWSELQIPTADVLSLTPYAPLIGHKSGKAANTHWICFVKP